MTNQPGTDRDLLTQKAYASDELLAIRQRIHELYSVPKMNFSEWVLDHVQWQGNESVLDVGSGQGGYFELIRQRTHGTLIAGDLSLGMARKARENPFAGPIANLDVQALPFPDASFDFVLANHMLYHVPDIDKALDEIHRVLKPNGCLVAATNSQFNQPEFEQLIRRTYSLLGAIGPEVEAMHNIDEPFTLEEGTMKLSHHFFAVARYDLPGAFIFPSAQPVLEYLNSTRTLREPQLPRKISWEEFIGVMTEQVQRLINHFGELVVNKLSGVLIATDHGDFAQSYVETLERLQS